MNRTLLYFVLTILVAGWLGHLIAKDPGYVLLSYDGATLQTSLWFLCAAIVTALVVAYLVIRIVRLLVGTGGSISNWRAGRKHTSALSRTTSGIVNLIEGNWSRARDLLISSAQESPTPLVNYLAAAKAAHELGDSAKREQLFKLAEQHSVGAELAIRIFQSRLAAESGDWSKVADLLTPLKANAAVNQLLMEANRQREDWVACKELLPQFKKTATAQAYAEAERMIWIELFNRSADGDGQLETLQKLWKQLPGSLKTDPQLLASYTKNLLKCSGEKDAELAVRRAIDSKWQPSLVRLYGRINAPENRVQVKAVESWLVEHPEDAAVHLCMGRLCLRTGDEEKAISHLEKSRSLESTVEVLQLLGKLKAKSGNIAASNELYLLALAAADEK